MKKVLAAVLMGLMLTACTTKSNNELNELNELNSMNTTLNLTQEWDKTFPKSDKVDHKKVTGKNPDGKSITIGNKELMIIPDAVHTDLYDDKNGKIPYDKMEQFFKENLK